MDTGIKATQLAIPSRLLVLPAIGLYLKSSPEVIPIHAPRLHAKIHEINYTDRPANFATCTRSTAADARPCLSSPRC